MPSVDAVLFDLDGTLVHTAPCIAAALNRALAVRGLGAIDPEVASTMIGRGVPVLIQRALTRLGVEPQPALVDALLSSYRTFYLEDAASMPVAYPGVAFALSEMRAMGMKLGVVTNTYDRFVRTILQHAGLMAQFDVVVSADTLPERKPHPAPLHHACSALEVTPERALFVGDSRNDAEAARAARMPMVCATYGYNEGKPVDDLPCLAFLSAMGELPSLLRRWARGERP